MLLGHAKQTEYLKMLADSGDLAHGYIFFGQVGVGKRKVAQALAGYLEHGVFDDDHKIRIDATEIDPDENGTIGIERARDVKRFLFQKPNKSTKRTLIIDQADALTPEAENALLKVTEEPPASALIIFIVQDPQSLLPTLRSRFRELFFPSLTTQEIAAWLQREKKCTAEKAEMLAKDSHGRPGFALRLMEDELLQYYMKCAKQFLKTSNGNRKEFVKELLANDSFLFTTFVDALIELISRSPVQASPEIKFWHKLLRLRQNIATTNLNPRLQLENLLWEYNI